MQMTDRIISALACVLLAVACNSPEEPAVFKSDRCAGVYQNYDFSADVIDEPAPKGYKAFYITHYGRHGARHINREWEYDAVAEVLGNAALTPLGEEIKAEFDRVYPSLKGRATDLTDIGRAQHRLLARRMYKAWPEVFRRGCDVEAISSDIPRCILSMTTFLGSPEECSSSVRTYADVNSALVPVLKKKPVVRIDADRVFYEKFDVDALYARLFTDVSAAKELYDVPGFVRSLYYFGTHLRCAGFDGTVMESAFTEDQASIMAYLDDYKFSHHCGWSEPLNVASSWPLLEHFVTMADEDIASGNVDVRLRFGHDNTLMPFMALAKLGVFAEKFFECENVPMAANVRWVYARNKAGEVIVKVQYNESDITAWMPWSEFRSFCMDQIEWAKDLLNEAGK